VTWSGDSLESAVIGAQLANLGLIVEDPQNGQNYESRFASRENGDNTVWPRLEIDWSDNGDGEGCEAVAPGTLLITRWGQTPGEIIPWNTATTVPITINFTIHACGADFSGIKVQGGMAANTATQGWNTCPGEPEIECPAGNSDDVGTVGDSIIGNGKNKVQKQGNKVLTWTIPSLAQGTSATLTIKTLADLNNQGQAACGVKNLTGQWSASGMWINAGTPETSSSSVGQLVVELECPII
jgi:hypothetical protein